jgi:hypothetical protein
MNVERVCSHCFELRQAVNRVMEEGWRSGEYIWLRKNERGTDVFRRLEDATAAEIFASDFELGRAKGTHGARLSVSQRNRKG